MIRANLKENDDNGLDVSLGDTSVTWDKNETVSSMMNRLENKKKITHAEKNPFSALIYDFFPIDEWIDSCDKRYFVGSGRYVNSEIMSQDAIHDLRHSKIVSKLCRIDKFQWSKEDWGDLEVLAGDIFWIMSSNYPLIICVNIQIKDNYKNQLVNFLQECFNKKLIPENDNEYPFSDSDEDE